MSYSMLQLGFMDAAKVAHPEALKAEQKPADPEEEEARDIRVGKDVNAVFTDPEFKGHVPATCDVRELGMRGPRPSEVEAERRRKLKEAMEEASAAESAAAGNAELEEVAGGKRAEADVLLEEARQEVRGTDGGVHKTVTKEPAHFEKCFEGVEVTLTYALIAEANACVAALDVGSPDKPEGLTMRAGPVRFTLGDQECYKRLKLPEWLSKTLCACLEAMSLTEEALFHLGPGYAPEGLPEATLALVLHDIHRTQGSVADGYYKRRVKSSVVKGGFCEEGSHVKVRFREVEDSLSGGYDPSDRVVEDEEEWLELEFEVGDGRAMGGIDRCVRNMRVEEVSRLYLKGEPTLPDIPAEPPEGYEESDELHLEVELLSERKGRGNKFDMAGRAKVEHAEMLRQQGNQLFKAGRVRRAEDKYDAGAGLFNCLKAAGDKEKGTFDQDVWDENDQCRRAQIPHYLNAALCKYKRGAWAAARDDCIEALDLKPQIQPPDMARALFRKAQCFVELHEWEQAERDFKEARRLYPKKLSKDVTRELAKLSLRINEQDAKDRKVVSRMMQKKQGETGGNYFFSEGEKKEIRQEYEKGLPAEVRKRTVVMPERIESIQDELDEIDEEEDWHAMKKREAWYNEMIRTGQMKVSYG